MSIYRNVAVGFACLATTFAAMAEPTGVTLINDMSPAVEALMWEQGRSARYLGSEPIASKAQGERTEGSDSSMLYINTADLQNPAFLGKSAKVRDANADAVRALEEALADGRTLVIDSSDLAPEAFQVPLKGAVQHGVVPNVLLTEIAGAGIGGPGDVVVFQALEHNTLFASVIPSRTEEGESRDVLELATDFDDAFAEMKASEAHLLSDALADPEPFSKTDSETNTTGTRNVLSPSLRLLLNIQGSTVCPKGFLTGGGDLSILNDSNCNGSYSVTYRVDAFNSLGGGAGTEGKLLGLEIVGGAGFQYSPATWVQTRFPGAVNATNYAGYITGFGEKYRVSMSPHDENAHLMIAHSPRSENNVTTVTATDSFTIGGHLKAGVNPKAPYGSLEFGVQASYTKGTSETTTITDFKLEDKSINDTAAWEFVLENTRADNYIIGELAESDTVCNHLSFFYGLDDLYNNTVVPISQSFVPVGAAHWQLPATDQRIHGYDLKASTDYLVGVTRREGVFLYDRVCNDWRRGFHRTTKTFLIDWGSYILQPEPPLQIQTLGGNGACLTADLVNDRVAMKGNSCKGIRPHFWAYDQFGRFQSRASRGQCLAANNTLDKVELKSCSLTLNEQWYWEGDYLVSRAGNTNMAIRVLANGTIALTNDPSQRTRLQAHVLHVTPPQAVLFSETDFGGSFNTYEGEVADLGTFSDQADSLYVDTDCAALLTSDTNWNGTAQTYLPGSVIPDLGSNSNSFSSLRTVCRQEMAAVAIFENPTFGGKKLELIGSFPDLAWLIFDNMISSIEVVPGCTATLYKDANYGEPLLTVSGGSMLRSLSPTINDQISSIRIDCPNRT